MLNKFALKAKIRIFLFVFLSIIFLNIFLYNHAKRSEISRFFMPIKTFKSCSSHLILNQSNHTHMVNKNVYSFNEIESNLKRESILLENGFYSTVTNKNCTSMSHFNVAIIVPYRNRIDHLNIFLSNMHPFLSNQNINYKIYIVEPIEGIAFNRALLFNAGFLEAIKDEKYSKLNWNCFIFHDVDLIPEDTRNVYKCNETYPLHFAVTSNAWNYSTSGYRKYYYGGVNAVTKSQYFNLNGMSNLFFGWGSEDDDFRLRTKMKYEKVIKLDATIGRYFMIKHEKEKPGKHREKSIEKSKSLIKSGKNEGLNTVIYQINRIELTYLFTRFYISYNETEILLSYDFKLS